MQTVRAILGEQRSDTPLATDILNRIGWEFFDKRVFPLENADLFRLKLFSVNIFEKNFEDCQNSLFGHFQNEKFWFSGSK